MNATNGSNGAHPDGHRDGHRSAAPAPAPRPLDTLGDGEDEQTDEELIRGAPERQAGGWRAAAIPMERSAKFGESVRRLFQVLGRDRSRLVVVGVLAVGSVALNVLGPKILGDATDTIIDGLRSPGGIDFGALHRTLLLAITLYSTAALLQVGSAWMVTGLVQRT